MSNYETIKEAGLEYVGYNPASGEHELFDPVIGQLEYWVANKGHASYGLIYKNTHLEFTRSKRL